MSPLPDGVLVSFYGDDFTGSSAVMEAFAFAGLSTILFLDVPTAAQVRRFSDHRVVGIAGAARAQDPAWMDRHLPPVFEMMAGLRAPLSLYKVCSTFDSSPRVGSIGRAIDLAAPILGGAWLPLLVAAPNMDRYQAFGNLFAAVGGVGYRLDRHPTMARHPVTPMDEADLRLHLARQTDRSIGLVDFVAMKAGRGDAALARERERAGIVSLDVLDDETLAESGRLIWENRGERIFAAGSQGVAYALVAHWRAAGLLPRLEADVLRAEPMAQIAVVSGSCSPVTAGQIDHAEAHGFEAIRIAAERAVDERAWSDEVARVAALALEAAGRGASPLVYTARGPDDPALAAMRHALLASGAAPGEVNGRIGAGLGRVLKRILDTTGLTRAVIAGGDTSSYAARELGIVALTALAPIAPGAPLCRAYAGDPGERAIEITLKGGQVGGTDFFTLARNGGPG